ncbi:MAG: T9SS type A sorting domain-containing protein [Bacteroidota bacterium]
MKFLYCFIVVVFTPWLLVAQGEEMGPITQHLSLQKSLKQALKISTTFDSTFIYTSDTLSLPFFDEFSKNKFQQYSTDFAAPGVTSEEYFHLLDDVTSIELPANAQFTAQVTFHRTFDLETSTTSDVPLTTTAVKVGSLAEYPVVYQTMNLYPPFYIYDTIGGPTNATDTIWITNPEIVQDSATQFFADLNDANALWLDSYVYHNYSFAKDPRTLGVATFDGIDDNGFPYEIGTTITNYADKLTSKPLDLSTLSDADSVYFSFLYQKQGLGDAPESGDSLLVEFYAKDLDQWFHVWSVNGGTVNDFTHGHIRVSDPKFFKKGFQFRFRNYGSMAGALDQFHIDYVTLRPLSGYQDTLFKDFAFVYPVGSLLKDYTAVPWDHYKNNPVGKMNDEAALSVHNGSNLPENNQNGKIEVLYNTVGEGVFVIPAQDLSNGAINYDPNSFYFSSHDLSGGYQYDITKPGTVVSFDIIATASAQFPNFPQNDSTFGVQQFAHFYSYDDGSAEAAYGPTGVQSQLAIRYEAYEADSLVGMQIHFVPSVNDVSDKLFLLTVWDDNGGVPGTILYQDGSFFPRQPSYNLGENQFSTYFFLDTMKVAVDEVFYVGWRQFDAERLNVGLDRNLDHKENTFYSINGGVNWSTSMFEGSVMIHPIFSTSLDAELGVSETIGDEIVVKVFPNPTSSNVTINMDGMDFSSANLFASDGRLVLSTAQPTFNVGDLTNGLYFLSIEGLEKTYKIIVNK